MVHLKTILDTRKPKADGTFLIMFRITQIKKVYYLSAGYSIKIENWNEANRNVNKNHPNAQSINASIAKRYCEIQKAIIQLDDEDLFSIDALKDKLGNKTIIVSFKDFTDNLITEMFQRNETGNAIVYQTAVNSLFKFKSSKSLRFTDITLSFINKYKEHLADSGCKVNTISNYLRTLRAIYNKAIKANVVDKRHYPFDEISISSERTAKRALSKEVIKSIESLQLPSNSAIAKARDFYMLSFYFIGINFTDIAYLTKDNICDGRMEYRRRKTSKLYNIKIIDKAQILIDRYSTNSKYLFQILPNDVVENSLLAKRLIQQWIKTTNKYMSKIAIIIGFEKSCITTYTVRHSWATIAKRLGYSKEIIAEALGHQQGNQVTEIYLDSFDYEIIDGVNMAITR